MSVHIAHYSLRTLAKTCEMFQSLCCDHLQWQVYSLAAVEACCYIALSAHIAAILLCGVIFPLLGLININHATNSFSNTWVHEAIFSQ